MNYCEDPPPHFSSLAASSLSFLGDVLIPRPRVPQVLGVLFPFVRWVKRPDCRGCGLDFVFRL